LFCKFGREAQAQSQHKHILCLKNENLFFLKKDWYGNTNKKKYRKINKKKATMEF
jgi:hypothetical protein